MRTLSSIIEILFPRRREGVAHGALPRELSRIMLFDLQRLN